MIRAGVYAQQAFRDRLRSVGFEAADDSATNYAHKWLLFYSHCASPGYGIETQLCLA